MAEVEGLERGANRVRAWAAGAAALLTLAGTAGAARLTGPEAGAVNGGIETASSLSGGLLGDLAAALPLGWAFGAGMVAAVNPCGFAMLPAYVAFYLGGGEHPRAAAGMPRRVRRSLLVSAAMTAGFVLLFGLAGLLVGVAAAALSGILPWVGLLVGVALVVAGGMTLGGGGLYTSVGHRLAERLGSETRRADCRGYFIYGLAYGAASLSCTLPVFLAVVGSALATDGLLPALNQFLLYALGMGSVITFLTLCTAVFGPAAGRLRAAARHARTVGAVLLLLSGAYIVYYWLTLGGALAGLQPD